jgi:TonB family protein
MRDKVLKRAILISIAVHLVAVSFIGRTSNTRLNAASMIAAPQRLLNVDLVKDPMAEPSKPVVRPDAPAPSATPTVVSPLPGHRTVSTTNNHTVGPNGGGPLNTGTTSRGGDLPGNWGGTTHVGEVPGSENGNGHGPGKDPGVGTPEPIRPDPLRHTDPPSPPPPTPAPKKVTVRVCDASGMLAGKHCDHTHDATFNEGNEPRRTCDRCKAPEPVHDPRTAAKKDPVRTRYVAPVIPDSIEEGQTFHMEIEYYVDTDGSVSDVRVTKSSGNRAIDREVTSKAAKWHYDPAVQDGVARRVKVTQPMTIKT